MRGTTVEVFRRVKQRVAVLTDPVEADILKADAAAARHHFPRALEGRLGGEQVQGCRDRTSTRATKARWPFSAARDAAQVVQADTARDKAFTQVKANRAGSFFSFCPLRAVAAVTVGGSVGVAPDGEAAPAKAEAGGELHFKFYLGERCSAQKSCWHFDHSFR